MGCGASGSRGKQSPKKVYQFKKKAFMKTPTVKFLKEIQDLVVMGKGIIHLVDDEKKVKDNLEVFAQAEPIFQKSDLTQPLGELLKKLPEVLNPLIEENRQKMKDLKPKAKEFLIRIEGYHATIVEMFTLIKHAEKRKVVDKPGRYINAYRLLSFLTSHLHSAIMVQQLGEQYKPVFKVIRTITICEKVAKSVKLIVKLLTKKIPFVKKCVLDYLGDGSGSSNPVVIAAKVAIKALLKPLKKKIEKMSDTGKVPSDFSWPEFDPGVSNWLGLKIIKKGKKVLDVRASLPKNYADMEMEDPVVGAQGFNVQLTEGAQTDAEQEEESSDDEEEDGKK